MIDKSIHILTSIIFASSIIGTNISYAKEKQGSEEVLSHKPIKGHDIYTGMPFRVYESVRNQNFEAQNNFSKMTFYIAPLFRLIPQPTTLQPYRRIVLKEEGIAIYTFLMECFHPRISRQALQSISNHYAQISSRNQFQFQLNKIQPMEHGMVVIKPSLPGKRLPKAIKAARKPANLDAPPNTILTLKAYEEFDIEVPLEVDDLFQQILGKDGSGIEFDFTTYFNVMNLRIKQIVWRADQIRKSEAYRELKGSGAKYYDANQIKELLDQVAREVATFEYQDVGIEDKLDHKVQQVFDTLTQRTQDIVLNSYDEAAAFEAKLLEGTGLSLNEFKPITLMWEVTKEIERMTDHKIANQSIRKAYTNQKEALIKELENYKRQKNQSSGGRGGKLSAGLNFKIFSFKLGGGGRVSKTSSSDVMENIKQAIDKLDHQIKDDTFKDEREFKNYKKELKKRKGKELNIVGRGLNVIEKNHLERNLSALGGYLAVRPFHEAKAFNVSSRLKPELFEKTMIFDNFTFILSLFRNTPFLEFYTATQRNSNQNNQDTSKPIPLEKGQYIITFHYSPPKPSLFYHFKIFKNNNVHTEISDNTGNIALKFELEPKDSVKIQIDCNKSYCQTGILSLTDITATNKRRISE